MERQEERLDDSQESLKQQEKENKFLKWTERKAFPIQAGMRKIGRNDPCPCGSGKKFKKCCWSSFN